MSNGSDDVGESREVVVLEYVSFFGLSQSGMLACSSIDHPIVVPETSGVAVVVFRFVFCVKEAMGSFCTCGVAWSISRGSSFIFAVDAFPTEIGEVAMISA